MRDDIGLGNSKNRKASQCLNTHDTIDFGQDGCKIIWRCLFEPFSFKDYPIETSPENEPGESERKSRFWANFALPGSKSLDRNTAKIT